MRLALLVLLVSATAHAYPQFQLSTGAARCTTCHFSPGGGGLLNAYGRDEAGSTISRGGDGRFAHGGWEPPAWLALGADVRLAGFLKLRAPDADVAVFPMQTDVYVRAGGDSISFTATLGSRPTRPPSPPLVERLASREHYVMYERGDTYVRAGRFFPIFGVRSQDHTAYVRRFLGFATLEEPYGVGAGTTGETWEAHVSAFVPRPVDFLGSGVKATGATVYVEAQRDHAALAAQARVAVSDADRRVAVGVVGKRFLPDAKLMLLGELDLQRQAFADIAAPRYQLAGYLGASMFVAEGWMVGAAVHHWQPDLRLRSARDAFEVNVQVFPRAHFELHLLVRASGEGDFDAPGLLSFLQLHYYL